MLLTLSPRKNSLALRCSSDRNICDLAIAHFYRGLWQGGQSADRLGGAGGTVRGVLVAVRGRGVVLAAIVLTSTCASGCSSNSPTSPVVRAGAVYETVVQWFAQSSSTDPDPLPVFIEPRGEGTSIGLDVQAELVKSTHDLATVKFIDSRDEALITNADGTVVVADGGILIRLAPVIEKGKKVRLDVDVHEHDETFRTMQFDLSLVGENWVLDQQPIVVPAG